MVDIHSHLLPGVDDGSKSIEMSVPVLERFAADAAGTAVFEQKHRTFSRFRDGGLELVDMYKWL